jgi:hypothetical protein
MEVIELVNLLNSKNNKIAHHSMEELRLISEKTNLVYPYMDQFIEMLDSDNSYVRTRGLILIAANAKWDIDYKIDEIINRYLKHITDKKPITSRQCINMLPTIVQYKPELKEEIMTALSKADITTYADSMQPLVYKDIRETLEKIRTILS